MNRADIIEGELYTYSPYGKKPRKIRCIEHFDDFSSFMVEDETSPSDGVQMNIVDSDAKMFITEIPKQ